LAFGIVGYLFYDESKQAASKEKEARDAAAAANQAAEGERVARIIYALYLDLAEQKDIDALINLQKHANYDIVLGKLNDKYKNVGPTWDGTTMKPSIMLPDGSKQPATTIDLIRKLREDNNALDAKLKAAVAAAKTAETEYVSKIGVEESGKNAALKAQKDAYAAEVAAKALDSAKTLGAFKTIEEIREELANLKKLMESKEIDANRRLKELVKSLEEKDIKLKKILEEIESKREALYTDRPHGKITKVDNRNGIAWINLGSADFVRTQLTFSIAAPNAVTTSGRRERKGAVEVTRVLDEHLSQVKIVDVTNATQDPILEGDQIFNPAWDPTRPMRIAIAGHVDKNSDGLDDTAELVRDLQKQGIQIDAWLDMKEIKVEGPGISGVTDFLILGDSPQSDAGLGGLTIGNREERKKQIRDKMDEMKSSAKDKGVEIIQWRRFLSRIGYALPKGTGAPAEFNPPGTLRQKLPGEGKTEEKKDEKKDEGK
jgi:hypothetical protein